MENQSRHLRQFFRLDYVLLIFFLILYGCLAVRYGKDNGYDFLNYHFYSGYAFIYHRYNIDYAPAGFFNFFNPLLDVLNYLIITWVGNAKAVVFIFGAICGIGAFIFYKLVDLLIDQDFSPRLLYVFLACLIGLSGPTCLGQIGSAQNDFQSIILITLALYFVLKVVKDHSKTWTMFFAGCIAGFGIGLKLTGAPYGFAMVLSTFIAVQGREKVRLSFLLALGLLLGFLISNGWWMAMLYHRFHNPMFPFYNKIFQSPYYPDANIPTFGVKSLSQVLTYPYRLTHPNMLVTEVVMQDWRLAILLTLALIFALLRALSFFSRGRLFAGLSREKTKPWAIFLMVFALSSYLMWIVEFGLYRYAIPIELVSGILIVYFYHRLFKQGILAKTGLILLSLFIVHETIVARFPRIPAVGKYIEVLNVPAFPPHSLVVMSDLRQSFVIPFFPPSVVFSSPSYYPGIPFPLGIEAILKHKGPVFILLDQHYASSKNSMGLVSMQNQFKIKIKANQCSYLLTNTAEQPGFTLCPIKIISVES